MRKALILSVISTAIMVLPVAAGASNTIYNTVRTDDKVTVYGTPETGLSGRYADDYWLYTSPYMSQTHALHPYYRHTYYSYNPASQVDRVTRPEFYKYLSDLYYNGLLGAGLPPYQQPSVVDPSTRCYNYRAERTNSRVPPRFTGCY